MGGDDLAERTAAVERLRGTARTQARDGDEGAQELEHALAFLGELDLRTLREIERELARPDSMITSPAMGAHGGLTAFLGMRYAAAFPASRYHPSTPVPQIRARLLDTLVFREIRTAHGSTMFDRSVRGVQGALGLSSSDSLAETGFPEYGAAAVFLLLDVAASFATVQLGKTSAHITASMGYSGMDAYADALDACHFMTAAFAKHLLRSPPDPDKLVAMAARGRLDALGISPTDLDGDRLLAELSKLRDRLPELSGPYSTWGPADSTVRRRPPDTAGREDDLRRSFSVSRRPGRPRTAGEAEQHHLSRKDWSWWVREHRVQLAAVLAIAAIAIFWWSARAAALELSGRLIVLAGLMGAVAGAALAALLDSRAQALFRAAEGLSIYTVLQGRRDTQFLGALRTLRPDLFAGARHAGLPRLVTVVVERNGVLFLGRGSRPPVVAAFHWLHVLRIIVPDDPPGTPRRRAHRVAFEVRRQGADVVLSLPLEREGGLDAAQLPREQTAGGGALTPAGPAAHLGTAADRRTQQRRPRGHRRATAPVEWRPRSGRHSLGAGGPRLGVRLPTAAGTRRRSRSTPRTGDAGDGRRGYDPRVPLRPAGAVLARQLIWETR